MEFLIAIAIIITLFKLLIHAETECSRGAYLNNEEDRAELKLIKIIITLLVLTLIFMGLIFWKAPWAWENL